MGGNLQRCSGFDFSDTTGMQARDRPVIYQEDSAPPVDKANL